MLNAKDQRRQPEPRRTFCILHSAFCLAGGCAKAQAKAAPQGPPLSVPAPPPRVLAPVEEEPLAENPPTPEPVATPPRQAPKPPPAVAPRRPATTATAEPEPKPETPVPPPATEPPAAAPRPNPTQADLAAAQKVRDVVKRALNDLGNVTYQKLSQDGKAQYDQSKRFTDQAEQALTDRNYAFAATLADKAATLATELLSAAR
jgi:outer membrane biosynthesis protein TonB